MSNIRESSHSPQSIGIPGILPLFFLLLFLGHFSLIAQGGGLQILMKKDSAVFRRNSIELNCSEPACHGPLERIYCAGPMIWATWQFGMQKECPGNRLRFPPNVVLKNFEKFVQHK
jgi:hypothetical protein